MKRLTSLIAFGCLLFISVSVAAEESDMFVKTIPITKIYSSSLGFKVLYPKGDLSFGELYLPADWFNKAGGQGEITWGYHASYPCMSIFWQNGKFHHIRLYLEKDMNSSSWAVLQEDTENAVKFNVEDLKLN